MKLLLLLILLVPAMVFCQLPDALHDKVRTSTGDYSIYYETVPIVCSKTLPCLEVRINGKGPYNFLIDLGSNVVLFKQSVVEEANVDILVDRSRGDIVKAGSLGKPDSTCIKYERIDRMPYLKSKIGNRISYINFDTGAALWLYFPLQWKDSLQFKTPIAAFKEMSNNQTGKVMTYIGQIKDDISFGKYTIESPYVVFDPEIEDIYVGSSLLNQFKLSFFPKFELVKMERPGKDNLIVVPKDQ